GRGCAGVRVAFGSTTSDVADGFGSTFVSLFDDGTSRTAVRVGRVVVVGAVAVVPVFVVGLVVVVETVGSSAAGVTVESVGDVLVGVGFVRVLVVGRIAVASDDATSFGVELVVVVLVGAVFVGVVLVEVPDRVGLLDVVFVEVVLVGAGAEVSELVLVD